MDSELHEINITPFTDVLLVLLVIFMILAALTLPPGFERELPCTCGPVAPVKPSHDIAVVVERSGVIRVDGRQADSRSIYRLLTRAAIASPHAGVELYGSAGAPYGTIMRVLDAAKDAGIANLTFVTQ